MASGFPKTHAAAVARSNVAAHLQGSRAPTAVNPATTSTSGYASRSGKAQVSMDRLEKQTRSPAGFVSSSGCLLPMVGSSHPVMQFLQGLGLGRYAQQVVRGGFDDVDVLMEITLADLQDLGIPSIDAFKLIEAIRSTKERTRVKKTAENPDEAIHRRQVISFLEESGLSQYADVFLKNGFDEMEILASADDEDLKEVGVLRGHMIKLRKSLQKHQEEEQNVSAKQKVAVPKNVVTGFVARYDNFANTVPTELMKSAVEKSWEQVKTVGTEVLAERLYKHFFNLAPDAIALFPARVLQKYRDWTADEGSSDDSLDSAAMRKLWAKVIHCVGCSVAGLHDVNRLVPMLRQLGARHINYGGTEVYWEVCGQALNCALQESLGSGFTAEVEQAWTRTFSFIAAVMISGLHEARAIAREASAALSETQRDETCSVRSTFSARTSSASNADVEIRLKSDNADATQSTTDRDGTNCDFPYE